MIKNSCIFLCSLLIFLLVSVSKAYATQASLSCTPSTGTYNVGDTFTVDYILDTREFPVFGAVIEATFDPGIILPQAANSTPVKSVTSWTDPVTNTVDNALGKISMDYGNTQASFTGNTSIGQLLFKAMAAGQTQFNYTYFQPYDDTTPVVAKVWAKVKGENLSNGLSDVYNCIYLVEASEVPTATPTLVSGVPTSTPEPGIPTPTPTPPRAGSAETTISLFALSFLLIGLGVAAPAIAGRKS